MFTYLNRNKNESSWITGNNGPKGRCGICCYEVSGRDIVRKYISKNGLGKYIMQHIRHDWLALHIGYLCYSYQFLLI